MRLLVHQVSYAADEPVNKSHVDDTMLCLTASPMQPIFDNSNSLRCVRGSSLFQSDRAWHVPDTDMPQAALLALPNKERPWCYQLEQIGGTT